MTTHYRKAAAKPQLRCNDCNHFEEYKAAAAEYTVEKHLKCQAHSKENLIKLAKQYADPNIKVMSLWTMGMNQHTRGVWMNSLVYNIHLLTGKISYLQQLHSH
ncbi:molybdopterin-dependent oxidoreductase [Vibrio chagasii]|nr:molybdopterin-dependent oxidoreductase [Vibrio chagasii]